MNELFVGYFGNKVAVWSIHNHYVREVLFQCQGPVLQLDRNESTLPYQMLFETTVPHLHNANNAVVTLRREFEPLEHVFKVSVTQASNS